MKPGVTVRPCASIVRAAAAFPRRPMSTMRPPRMAMSVASHGLPLPSSTRPFLMSRSYCCGAWAKAHSKTTQDAKRKARHARDDIMIRASLAGFAPIVVTLLLHPGRMRLKHVSDAAIPGIRRLGWPGHFRYADARGRAIRDRRTLDRIRALAIPPAWTHVWICPDPNGHLQATGRDARGRKQYRYHPRWREVRDESKYGRMMSFAAALPEIRGRVDADLGRPGLPREKVLAAVIRLLETT